MTVDFASKQRDRGGSGWGLRNAKLRMSRKLIFASGLLVCFGCHLDPTLQSKISTAESDIRLNLVNHIRDYIRLTPLQIIAKSIEMYEIPASISRELFSSYSDFIEMLGGESREILNNLRSENSRTDPIFQHVQKVSERFQHALSYIFFEDERIAPLTQKYGVF